VKKMKHPVLSTRGSALQVCGHESFSIRQHRSLLVSG